MCVTLISEYRGHRAGLVLVKERLELIHRFHLEQRSTGFRAVLHEPTYHGH